MSERNLKTAVRINSEKPSVVDVDTKTGMGNIAQYTLISIPFYLAEEIDRILSQ